jgi:hypothetical protein
MVDFLRVKQIFSPAKISAGGRAAVMGAAMRMVSPLLGEPVPRCLPAGEQHLRLAFRIEGMGAENELQQFPFGDRVAIEPGLLNDLVIDALDERGLVRLERNHGKCGQAKTDWTLALGNARSTPRLPMPIWMQDITVPAKTKTVGGQKKGQQAPAAARFRRLP